VFLPASHRSTTRPETFRAENGAVVHQAGPTFEAAHPDCIMLNGPDEYERAIAPLGGGVPSATRILHRGVQGRVRPRLSVFWERAGRARLKGRFDLPQDHGTRPRALHSGGERPISRLSKNISGDAFQTPCVRQAIERYHRNDAQAASANIDGWRRHSLASAAVGCLAMPHPHHFWA